MKMFRLQCHIGSSRLTRMLRLETALRPREDPFSRVLRNAGRPLRPPPPAEPCGRPTSPAGPGSMGSSLWRRVYQVSAGRPLWRRCALGAQETRRTHGGRRGTDVGVQGRQGWGGLPRAGGSSSALGNEETVQSGVPRGGAGRVGVRRGSHPVSARTSCWFEGDVNNQCSTEKTRVLRDGQVLEDLDGQAGGTGLRREKPGGREGTC